MSLLDWFRTSPRQREPQSPLYDQVAELRTDMRELQREMTNVNESTLKALRKIEKRASREGCAGCADKDHERADPGAVRSGSISVLQARQRYPGMGGF